MALPDIIIEIPRPGGLWRSEGFGGVPIRNPLLITLVPAACEAARRNAEGLFDALRSTVLRLLGGSPLPVPGPPAADGTHSCRPEADPQKRSFLVVLVGADEPGCAFPGAWETWSAARPPHRFFPVFPAGFHPETVLAEPLQKVNAGFWEQTPGELVHAVLGIAGLIPADGRIFISYRRRETQPLADQLFDRLAREGFDVFVDRFRIPVGVEDFQQRLTAELVHKSMVVILESRGILQSPWTEHEVNFATSHRMGVLALRLPGVPGGATVAGLEKEQRHLLTWEHFRRDGKRLTAAALREVVARIREEHTRALVYRRRLMRESLLEALRQEGIAHPRTGPDGMLLVRSTQAPPREYALFLTTRAPDLPDFHVTHGHCSLPMPRGVIVGPDPHLAGELRDRLAWLSRVSEITVYDEGQMSRVAEAVAKGAI